VNPADGSTWVFVSDANGLAALQLTINPSGDPSLALKWVSSGGTSPLVANGVVYIAHSGKISALKATDGSLLWSNTSIGATTGKARSWPRECYISPTRVAR